MKNEILNCDLVWPKKEWNPHSKALFFSWYGVCGANKKLTPNKTKPKIGTNIIKKVILVIIYLRYILKQDLKGLKYPVEIKGILILIM